MPITRTLVITDKYGIPRQIKTLQDLQQILNQMTPEELALFQARYRFTPIHNATGNINYTGTIKDLL